MVTNNVFPLSISVWITQIPSYLLFSHSLVFSMLYLPSWVISTASLNSSCNACSLLWTMHGTLHVNWIPAFVEHKHNWILMSNLLLEHSACNWFPNHLCSSLVPRQEAGYEATFALVSNGHSWILCSIPHLSTMGSQSIQSCEQSAQIALFPNAGIISSFGF